MLWREKRRDTTMDDKHAERRSEGQEDEKESTKKLDKSEVDEVAGGKGDPNGPIVTPEL
jgi:hypothetical protein